MRPRSWEPPTEYTYEKDEREIGTILQVTKEGIVKVQWDSSDDIQDFKKGPTGQYDLLLFDNAQTGKPLLNYLRLHFVHDVMIFFIFVMFKSLRTFCPIHTLRLLHTPSLSVKKLTRNLHCPF